MVVEADMPIHCDVVSHADHGHTMGEALSTKLEGRGPLQLSPQIEVAGRCGAQFSSCWLKC